MTKVVINKCCGGFSISQAAAEFMAERGNKRAIAELEECRNGKDDRWYGYGYTEDFHDGYPRDDADLIAAVESLGSDASTQLSKIQVVDVPEGVEWEIEEYAGEEWIAEKHRTWS